jgi:hypothetical protein
MAKFSQAFLQQFGAPGLFEQAAMEAAGKFAGLPAQMRKQQEAERLKSMGPVDLAKYSESQAMLTGDPLKVLQAQQVTQNVVQERTQQSLSQLDMARQKAVQEGNIAQAESIEETMEKVAAEAGLDPSKITGRTATESAQVESQREANFIKAYYSVEPENLDKFVKAAKDAGYGSSIQRLEDDRIQRDENNRKIAEGQRDRTKPLPTTGVEKRLEGLPAELQDDLKQRIADVKASEPNFAKGETWTQGGRQDAERQLRSIEDQITQYKVTTLQKLNTARRQLQGSINSERKKLNSLVAKDPSSVDVAQYISQAMDNLNKNRVWGFELDSKDQRVKEEAIRLARQQQEVELQQIRRQSQLTIQELEEQLRLVDAELGGGSKKEAEDPLGIR